MENPTEPVSIDATVKKPERGVRLDGKRIVPIYDANVTDGNGLKLTDDVGLPMHPAYYAKPGCSTCNGRGTYETSRQMTVSEALKLTGGAVKAQVIKEMTGSGEGTINKDRMNDDIHKRLTEYAKHNKTVSSHTCGCANRRYVKARELVLKENEEKGIQPVLAKPFLTAEQTAQNEKLLEVLGSFDAPRTVLRIEADGTVK